MIKQNPAPSTTLVAGLRFLFLILFFLPSTAGAKEEIIWVKRHFPPAFILKGDLAGQGLHDKTVALLQEQMPEYRHRVILANHPRMKKMMQDNANVCRAGLFKNPDRERTMYMSIAHILVPPCRIYMSKSRLKQIQPILEAEGHNRVSLERLIQNHPELKLIIEAQRSYGKDVDKVLDRYRDNPIITKRYGSDARGYIKMLLAGHTDYMVEIPSVFLYLLHEAGATMENLCSLEIAESRDFQPASIGCSKTPAGRAIIGQINTILRKERGTEAFRQNIERWLDEDTIPAFRKAYETVFLADAPRP